MPEHVHLLFGEPERGDPSVVMKVLKQSFARQLLNRSCGRFRLDFLHQGFHGEALGSVEFCQSVYYSVSLPLGSVLAYLPLAF
jgi:REP element-mobilizing transposase RayT